MFPTESPYRIDQVMAAPAWMAGLFLAQVLMISLMSGAAAFKRERLWMCTTFLYLVLVAIFFTLASWGTSDPTKISHNYENYLGFGVNFEPFWWWLGPIVRLLPYRMAAVQGLVATGFAAAPLFLARRWGVPAWGGWWSLLIICSPLLRGFLQNSHSRQALSVLLLLPLFLWAARLVRLGRFKVLLTCVLSAMVHTTFPANLALGMSPFLMGARVSDRLRKRLSAFVQSPFACLLGFVVVALTAVFLGRVLGPMFLQKYESYRKASYFDSYAIHSSVVWLQCALAAGVALAIAMKRLNPISLMACHLTRLMAFFGLLYCAIQASIRWQWLPQVTCRLADAVGFFLLISFIVWLHHYQAHWYLLPALSVNLVYWFDDRILASATLMCGQNDDFLCVPDRWPWLIRY